MAVSVGTNIFSLRAQRSLSSAAERLSASFERVSSGRRINRASDDAAGLAIAEKLSTDSRIYTQAIRNVNDAMSYLTIADGALGELSNITSRQLELAEQAANGVYTYSQRRAITAEANALVREFNRIVESTEFNGRKILDVGNDSGELRIQAGLGLSGSLAFDVGRELSRSVGTGTFGESVSYLAGGSNPEGNSLNAIAVADIDGDGTLDLVTAGYFPEFGSGASIQFNDGHGSFGSPVTLNAGLGFSSSSAVAAADLDSDGTLDLVTANYVSSQGETILSIFFNDGHGSFGGAVSHAPGHYTVADLCLADINGDGATDIVGAGYMGGGGLSGNAIVQLNDGRGNFGSAVSYATEGNYSCALSLADINGDGAPDLVTAGAAGAEGRATVRFNDGRGNFGSAVSYATEGSRSDALSLADINGDGAPDLVTAGFGGATGRATVRLNDGRGIFGSAVSYAMEGSASYALSLADTNGDGAPDLATAGSEGAAGRITVRLNDGQGSFGGAVSYARPQTPVALSLGDINGDGALDLLSAGGSRTHVSLADTRDVTTVATVDLFSHGTARQALTALQDQLARISAERGAIGAFQSRLSVALNTLSVNRETADAAAVRITDSDVAHESAELVKNQILLRAGSTVLAQANVQPSLAISLLA